MLLPIRSNRFLSGIVQLDPLDGINEAILSLIPMPYNPSDFSILASRGTFLLEHALSIDPHSASGTTEREATLGLARRELLKALELSEGKSAAAHLQLARLYEKTGDRRKAADELEQYLKLSLMPFALLKTLRSLEGEKKP